MSNEKWAVTIKLFHGVNRKDTDIYRIFIDDLDRQLLADVLEMVRFNQVKAAALLGISRGNLRTKLIRLFGDKYVGIRESK